jgi:hypothetical protein
MDPHDCSTPSTLSPISSDVLFSKHDIGCRRIPTVARTMKGWPGPIVSVFFTLLRFLGAHARLPYSPTHQLFAATTSILSINAVTTLVLEMIVFLASSFIRDKLQILTSRLSMVTIFQGKIQGVGHDDMLAAKLAGYVSKLASGAKKLQ